MNRLCIKYLQSVSRDFPDAAKLIDINVVMIDVKHPSITYVAKTIPEPHDKSIIVFNDFETTEIRSNFQLYEPVWVQSFGIFKAEEFPNMYFERLREFGYIHTKGDKIIHVRGTSLNECVECILKK